MSEKLYIGVDQGVDGGIAIIYPVGVPKYPTMPTIVFKMPVIKTVVGKKTRSDWDENGISEQLAHLYDYEHDIDIVLVIEKLTAMPLGSVRNFLLGGSQMMWRTMAMYRGFRLELVRPQEWKQEMLGGTARKKLGKGKRNLSDKTLSIQKAKQLFPELESTIGKHDGLAEALLIAEYGRRKNL